MIISGKCKSLCFLSQVIGLIALSAFIFVFDATSSMEADSSSIELAAPWHPAKVPCWNQILSGSC